ncbi:uncharacterized protein [Miscanthus floridulus]|uniref:uncharacterized protein n=1 Tax=Miscanthus floridulus TaxID=154761 RepID=UPI00345A7BDD
MKKEYTWFMELKNSATRLGWNEAKRTVECSKEWWNEHLARCNNPDKGIKCNHVRFRKQGPKHLDDLHILFDKIHVSYISSDESSDDDVSEVQKTQDIDDVKLVSLKKSKLGKKRKEHSSSIEEKDKKSPFFRLYKNTCLKIETAGDKISSSVEASFAPPTNPVPSILEAMKMLKDCGVQEKTALMHTTIFLIVKPEFREVFSSLETKEGRFDLIEREHEKELLKRQ